MQVYDKVNKTELTADTDELIKLMAPGGRQVDLYLKEKKSDEDGYMTWDVEHWSSVDGCRNLSKDIPRTVEDIEAVMN